MKIYITTIIILLTSFVTVTAFAASKLQGSHADRSLMSKSCRACHRGMTMVLRGEERTCLNCHGTEVNRLSMVEQGYLKKRALDFLTDIEREINKPYAHPTLSVKNAHHHNEVLPEDEVGALRHAECVDCHEVHTLDSEQPFAGLKGKRVGSFVPAIEKEYQLCYKCHADSVNLPIRSTNKHAEFKVENPSFHPVEGEGRQAYVVSLLEPYKARKEGPQDVSIISCSDCHGSDDPSGPAGPHGSAYRGLLKLNYQMEDGFPEGRNTYTLCYKCHDRNSILENESFPYHQQHIEGFTPDAPGTSCFTCHDAHGSAVNPYLIRFNEDVVQPPDGGKIEFEVEGVSAFRGSCTLVCHEVVHNPKKY